MAGDGGHRRQRPGEEAGGAADNGGHEVRRDIMRLLVTRGEGGVVTIIRVRTWRGLDTLTTAHTVRESANRYIITIPVILLGHCIITLCAISFDNRRRAGSQPR